MHKSATKCNETIGNWCKNKHGASKIIDTFETYQVVPAATEQRREGEGDLRPDCRVCVFSRRQSGPVSAFLLSGVPERAPGDRGWPGLVEWIKAQIRGKTRNRGRDWAKYRRPDVKNDRRGPSQGDGWRCSNNYVYRSLNYVSNYSVLADGLTSCMLRWQTTIS
jgi:hypothetical protein